MTATVSPVADLVDRLSAVSDAAARRLLLAGALRSGAEAHALLGHLKAESERYWTIDPHTSLRLAEALILGAQIAGEPTHEALGVMAKADAVRYLGRFPESLDLFEQAAQGFLTLGDEVGWARTRIGWLRSMQRVGRGPEALQVAERAREILARHQERFRAATLDLNTAVVHHELGQYDRALTICQRAHDMYVALGAIGEVPAAQTKVNMAILLTLRGDFRAALSLQEEARAVFARHGKTVSLLSNDQNIAYIYAGQGYFTRALRLLVPALAAADDAGLVANGATIARDIVRCYLALNRNTDARQLAGQTIARARRCGSPTEAARALFCAALAEHRLGNQDSALSLLESAAQHFAGTGLTTELALTALQRGRLHLLTDDLHAALEQAEHARRLLAERGLPIQAAEAGIVSAGALLRLGRLDEARGAAGSAMAVCDELEVKWLAHEAHQALGDVARARGDAPEALTQYHAAIQCIESVQSRLTNSLRTNFLDDKLASYHSAIDLCLQVSDVERAFDYLERAKSRALIDYLAGNVEVQLRVQRPQSQLLVDELGRLREEHNWFYTRLFGNGPTDGSPEWSAERAALLPAIKDREHRIAGIIERLALEGEEMEGLAAPPAGQRLPRPEVPAGTVLLEYYLRDDGGAVFVVGQSGLHVVPLATRGSEVRHLLAKWQLNLDASVRAIANGGSLKGLAHHARGSLQALHRALLRPVAMHLAGVERIVVVPYGPLHAVPFHALFDGHRFLVETHEVSTCPSSTLLRLCHTRSRRGGGSALVVAYSDGGRLPHVLDEARALAALLPGECLVEAQATREAVAAAAPRHGVLHLAAHADARLDNPAFAHLRLAGGQLSAIDVFNLDLEAALVTLSACESGRSAVTGGDELIGLSRGFLYAGASTLIQSLWRVEDGSTARLMSRFYQGLRAGKRSGAALRAAQLEMLTDHDAHPVWWAPFQLLGASRGL